MYSTSYPLFSNIHQEQGKIASHPFSVLQYGLHSNNASAENV
jgi:hypothetical protein